MSTESPQQVAKLENSMWPKEPDSLSKNWMSGRSGLGKVDFEVHPSEARKSLK
jgi:hypothetical protein